MFLIISYSSACRAHYKSIKYLRRYSEKICLAAIEDLNELIKTVDKEIFDLRRYKINVGGGETLTVEITQKLICRFAFAYCDQIALTAYNVGKVVQRRKVGEYALYLFLRLSR